MRTRTGLAWAGGLLLLLGLSACQGGTEPEVGVESGAIREGAPCSSSMTTVRCGSEGPLYVEGLGEACASGTRRCREGRWGPCEGIRYEPIDLPPLPEGVARQAVIGSPVVCGGCDPACYISRDDPTDVDTADPRTGWDDVAYDTGAGGLVIVGLAPPPPDADGDGVPDASDPLPADFDGDADGDGVPDAWEVELGTDPTVPDPPPPAEEWYVVLPYEGGTATRTIPPSIPLQVRRADVYFLIDTSSTMGGEIANLKSTITSFIIPEVQLRIADVQFGVGHFRDFGSSPPVPYQDLQPITSSAAAVNAAISTMFTSTAYPDYAESQTAALHSIATGSDLDCGYGAASCPAGYTGHPCFRPGSLPIIVVVTDAEFHNGVWDTLNPPAPSGCYEFSACSGGCFPLSPAVPALETVVTELTAIGAKVIGVWSGSWPGDLGQVSTWTWGRTYPDLDEVIDLFYTVEQTASLDGVGNPLLYGIRDDGIGMDVQIVDAIDDLVATMLLDVNASWSDPDGTAPDSAVLVEDVDPISCSLCGSLDTVSNTAYDVYPGSTVEFSVTLSNDTGEFPAGATAQLVDVLVQILGNGTAVLAERTVHVLIPAATITPPPNPVGNFTRLYDSAFFCVPPHRSYRTRLYFEADTPDTTSIRFYAESAEPPDVIDGSPEVFLGETPPESPYVFVSTPLEAAGPPSDPRARLLQIRAELLRNGSADTPVLHAITLEEYCE